MNRWIAAGLTAAGLIGFSGAANAQPTPAADDAGGMYCVYDDLVADKDYEIVAEVLLYSDATPADVATANKAVEAAVTACAVKFKLKPGQKDAVSDIGIYGAASDYLSEELMLDGVDEKTVAGIFTAMDGLTDEDLARMLEDDWRKHAPFVAKLQAALIANGVPDQSFVLETAYDMIMVSTLALGSVSAFMEENS